MPDGGGVDSSEMMMSDVIKKLDSRGSRVRRNLY